MLRKLSQSFSFAIALSLLVVGTAAFAAAPGTSSESHPTPHGPHALMVTLDSVSGTTLTVTARGEDSALTTIDASSAKIIVKGVTSTVSDLKSGDRLIVLGEISGTSVTATRITDGAGSYGEDQVLTGTITAISGNTITVSATQHGYGKRGSATPTTSSISVTTDTKTKFNVPGIKSAAITDVAVGSRVFVIGVDPTTGTGTARLVSVSPTPTHKKK